MSFSLHTDFPYCLRTCEFARPSPIRRGLADSSSQQALDQPCLRAQEHPGLCAIVGGLCHGWVFLECQVWGSLVCDCMSELPCPVFIPTTGSTLSLLLYLSLLPLTFILVCPHLTGAWNKSNIISSYCLLSSFFSLYCYQITNNIW